MDLYFSQHFDVSPALLEDYGAFDISVVSDLPLFVDPFLLFNSPNAVFQQLHQDILDYLLFLRDQAAPDLDPALIDSWYRFKEVKQNWLGFTLFGNSGQGLGVKFAVALHGALGAIFSDFGNETITDGTHLEKLCLIQPGVGKDNISDFTTNLIKGFLCEYTEAFAREHIDAGRCDTFRVERARFDYGTQTWATESYFLPKLREDFVLLTPTDMLTRDDTWINHGDMIGKFSRLHKVASHSKVRRQIVDGYERLSVLVAFRASPFHQYPMLKFQAVIGLAEVHECSCEVAHRNNCILVCGSQAPLPSVDYSLMERFRILKQSLRMPQVRELSHQAQSFWVFRFKPRLRVFVKPAINRQAHPDIHSRVKAGTKLLRIIEHFLRLQ